MRLAQSRSWVLIAWCWALGIFSLACFAAVFLYLAAFPICDGAGGESGVVAAFRLAPMGVECVALGSATDTANGWAGSWVMTYVLAAGCAGLFGTIAVRAVLETTESSSESKTP